ncbi:SUKH-4 family immunity protein [Embleya sp. NPDC020886]|uniref:SUKH-4 family immunity protein n=1 Tax=Embleya sp. NPDC020886 TaxID=3363980 RepID=UPI0037B19E84
MTTTTNATPRVPDAAWLEARFGSGSLWRPDEADLPAELTDRETRNFLTSTGFPAVAIDLVEFDSTHLRDADEPYLFDADELYGRRYPDDDSPPENFCFTIGMHFDQQLMVDTDIGEINHYDPSGWDHGDGDKGIATSSLPTLALLLGLVVERRDALETDDDGIRHAAIAELRVHMAAIEPEVDNSPFWDSVFDHLSA